MKMTVPVEFSGEAEVTISAEDIAAELGGSTDTLPDILRGLNNIAQFLRAIPDARIAAMTDVQRSVITQFLTKEAVRYAPGEHSL